MGDRRFEEDATPDFEMIRASMEWVMAVCQDCECAVEEIPLGDMKSLAHVFCAECGRIRELQGKYLSEDTHRGTFFDADVTSPAKWREMTEEERKVFGGN